MAPEKIVNLDPAKVRAEGNAVRYALLGSRVEEMGKSILEHGIIEPVEVVKLIEPVDGYTHQLVAGFYRHAAALKLNETQKAGVELPAIVRSAGEGKERFARQLAENVDRQELSPMDTARAIQAAVELGYSKTEIREMFKRTGGRKGNELTPVSNSFLNIHLSFLDLPRGIQAKLHDGRIGVASAMQLVNLPADQREPVLKRAEELRLKALEKEERADEREAKVEAKEGEREARVKAAEEAVTVATAALEAAAAAHEAKIQAQKEALMVGPEEARLGKPMSGWSEAERKAFAERAGVAKADAREADKALKDAKKAAEKAAAALAKLTAAPEDEGEDSAKDKKAKTTASPADVKRATKEAGIVKPVPLNAAETRAAVAELGKSRFGKVRAIAELFSRMLTGELVPKQVETDLSVLTGERAVKKA